MENAPKKRTNFVRERNQNGGKQSNSNYKIILTKKTMRSFIFLYQIKTKQREKYTDMDSLISIHR